MSNQRKLIKFIHETYRKNTGSILKSGFKIKRHSLERFPNLPWGVFGKDTTKSIFPKWKLTSQIEVKKKGVLREFGSREQMMRFLNKIDPTIDDTIKRADKSQAHWQKKYEQVANDRRYSRGTDKFDIQDAKLNKVMQKWRTRRAKLSAEAHTKMNRALKRAKIDVVAFETTEGGWSNKGNKTFIMRRPNNAQTALIQKDYKVKFIKKNGRIIPIKVKTNAN